MRYFKLLKRPHTIKSSGEANHNVYPACAASATTSSTSLDEEWFIVFKEDKDENVTFNFFNNTHYNINTYLQLVSADEVVASRHIYNDRVKFLVFENANQTCTCQLMHCLFERAHERPPPKFPFRHPCVHQQVFKLRALFEKYCIGNM